MSSKMRSSGSGEESESAASASNGLSGVMRFGGLVAVMGVVNVMG